MKRATNSEAHPLGLPHCKSFGIIARYVRELKSDRRKALVTAEFKYSAKSGNCTSIVKHLSFTDAANPKTTKNTLQFVIERRDDGWFIPDEEAVRQAYWAKQVRRLKPKSTVDDELVRLYGAPEPKHAVRGFVSRSQRPTYNLNQYDY